MRWSCVKAARRSPQRMNSSSQCARAGGAALPSASRESVAYGAVDVPAGSEAMLQIHVAKSRIQNPEPSPRLEVQDLSEQNPETCRTQALNSEFCIPNFLLFASTWTKSRTVVTKGRRDSKIQNPKPAHAKFKTFVGTTQRDSKIRRHRHGGLVSKQNPEVQNPSLASWEIVQNLEPFSENARVVEDERHIPELKIRSLDFGWFLDFDHQNTESKIQTYPSSGLSL